jgi:hypothetical protein
MTPLEHAKKEVDMMSAPMDKILNDKRYVVGYYAALSAVTALLVDLEENRVQEQLARLGK